MRSNRSLQESCPPGRQVGAAWLPRAGPVRLGPGRAPRGHGPARHRLPGGARRLAVVAVLGVAAVLAPPVLHAQAAPGPASGTGPGARLEAHLPRLMESGDIPGLSAALILDGRVAWTGTFGVADAATGEPVTPGTVFQAASLSKQVAAYTALRLVDRGIIELDRPLVEYLPNPRIAGDPRARRITARLVLAHASGLPNWGDDPLELRFAPGEGFGYSGEGYVYLARVLEELTGLELEELARREVFEPLGMESSAFVWRPAFEGRAAAGHDEWKESLGVRRRDEANAAASLLTTAEDYARFLIALLEGRGLRAATLEEALTRQVQVASNERVEDTTGRLYWGLGWGLQHGGGGRGIWQWGHNDGFRAYLFGYPDRRDAFVYFANGDNGLSIARDLLRLVAEAAGWPPDEHPALEWLGYEPHDAPDRRARRRLVRTFVQSGVEAGLARYAEMRRLDPDVVDEALVVSVGLALAGRGLREEGVALLRRAVRIHPESVAGRAALGELLMGGGRYDSALAAYRAAAELVPSDPGERAEIDRAIEWLEPAVEALARPVYLPPDALERLVGDYGPRHVTLRDGALHYQRDGNRRYRLIPMSEDTFLLDELGSFRIRFVSDDAGRVVRIVGLYVNGNEDETPRDR